MEEYPLLSLPGVEIKEKPQPTNNFQPEALNKSSGPKDSKNMEQPKTVPKLKRESSRWLKETYSGAENLTKGEYYSKEYILAKASPSSFQPKIGNRPQYRNFKVKCIGFYTSKQYQESIQHNVEEANKRLMTVDSDNAPPRIYSNLKNEAETAKRDLIKKLTIGNLIQDFIFRYEIELYGMKWM